MGEPKTIELPEALQEAVDTGLITQESLDVLEDAKLEAAKRIEDLRESYREGLISHEQLEGSIRGIRKEMQRKILALDFNSNT